MFTLFQSTFANLHLFGFCDCCLKRKIRIIMSGNGEIKVTSSTVIWEIEDFCKCNIKLTDLYVSPNFLIHGIKGNIYMDRRVDPDSKIEYISMYLDLEHSFDEINVFFTFSILSKENEVLKLECRKEFSANNPAWGFRDCLRSSSPLLAKGHLTIQCKISIDENQIEDKQNLTDKTSLTGSFNFEKFLFNEFLSDVQFIIGKEVVYAHKFILAARSDVFSAMFTHPTKESTENKVEIEDVDCKVIKEIFRYIYTQKVGDIETIIEGLLIAADKYLLNELKFLCESKLIDSLSYDNVFTHMVTAEKFNLNDLKKETVQFIASNSDDIIAPIKML